MCVIALAKVSNKCREVSKTTEKRGNLPESSSFFILFLRFDLPDFSFCKGS